MGEEEGAPRRPGASSCVVVGEEEASSCEVAVLEGRNYAVVAGAAVEVGKDMVALVAAGLVTKDTVVLAVAVAVAVVMARLLLLSVDPSSCSYAVVAASPSLLLEAGPPSSSSSFVDLGLDLVGAEVGNGEGDRGLAAVGKTLGLLV